MKCKSKSQSFLEISIGFDNLRFGVRVRDGTRSGRRPGVPAAGVQVQGNGASGHMYDLAIIGGGVNGCGIARDATGRGLSVLLAEKNDLASGTSSASTKLIHGGLRYLEHYEFRLVRESLKEREVLLTMAPHIIWPLRFVLPHHRALRPAFLIRLGLFLYDHLGGRKILPASRALDLTRVPAGKPLKQEFTRAFEYSDCWVDDARLVVLNAADARARGADIRVRTEVVSARRGKDHWQIELRDVISGRQETVQARALVNAAGAWVADVIASRIGVNANSSVRLVKGSHIVVRRLFEHDSAYIFQNADERIVFAIPYEQDFTLIGTTDVDFDGDPAKVQISSAEIEYLCGAVNGYFSTAIAPSEVVWSYAGVRPLYDEGDVAAQKATRDFVLELDAPEGAPALLNIFGGKITTYRHLAEEALKKLTERFPKAGAPWTRGSTLPGGDMEWNGRDLLARELEQKYPWLGAATARRLARTYGTVARDILSGAARAEDLGLHFGAGLHQREVEHLVRNEWALTAEDIVWRRTKLGLRLTQAEVSRLASWLGAHSAAAAAPAAARR
jgi:glycerol-3-phosphate dehydrogenase